ncbi:MAG: heme lyase CcmF/NrfE family subunit [Porticoccaceae bacterium]
MIPELGHFSLILSLALIGLLAIVPLLGSFRGNLLWMSLCRPLAVGQFVFVLFSYLCLSQAFFVDDFSVAYVANNSNTLLPWYYKLSAVWGAHEGSLLLWMLVLSTWILAVAAFSRGIPLVMVARVLAIMGMVGVGFCLFLLFTSNPFERALPFPPLEGTDLNPLLQDVGLIFHPPLLYMGYVGFSVPFAFALAALIAGRFDAAWARWMRLWTNTAWAFLTLGIALGSWWAYYELGWGGWWFWDPVENASFMPWLVGTALVHSLSVSEKRGIFRSWTLLLAIFAFSLSLLGTFLVRSGVLTSVHAFASDPTRGVFILVFLGVVVGGSLLLYGVRAQTMRMETAFSWLSREAFLLVNNMLLVIATAIILLGTLYPLLADVMGWGKISVGPPYFNLFFIPIAVSIALFMAPGSVLRWKKTEKAWLQRRIWLPLTAAVIGGLALPFAVFSHVTPGAMVSVAVFLWVIAFSLLDIWEKSGHSKGRSVGLRRLSGSYYGMQIAHVGVACAILGAGLTSIYTVEKDARIEAGTVLELEGYRFQFEGLRVVQGPNYVADEAHVRVMHKDREVADLYPQKRRYLASNQVMTEAGIRGTLWRDLYVSMGEPLEEGAWAVRVHVKPFVRWIWLGSLLMAGGGMLAMLDKRYRTSRARAAQDASSLAGSAT